MARESSALQVEVSPVTPRFSVVFLRADVVVEIPYDVGAPGRRIDGWEVEEDPVAFGHDHLSKELLLGLRDVLGVKVLGHNSFPERVLGCGLDGGELTAVKSASVPVDKLPVLGNVVKQV
jgi:hypothetical protein